MSQLPFVERYRPESLEDLAGDGNIRALEAFAKTGEFPLALIFYGLFGTGKTAAARGIVRDYYVQQGLYLPNASFRDIRSGNKVASGYEGIFSPVLWVDATITRDIDFIRDTIQNFMRVLAPKGTKKFIVIDEADQLSTDAQKALRSLLEKYPSTVTLYTTNYLHKIDEAIQSRASGGTFEFKKPSPEDVAMLLSKICSKEGVTVPEAVLTGIATESESVREAVGKLGTEIAIIKAETTPARAPEKPVSLEETMGLGVEDAKKGILKHMAFIIERKPTYKEPWVARKVLEAGLLGMNFTWDTIEKAFEELLAEQKIYTPREDFYAFVEKGVFERQEEAMRGVKEAEKALVKPEKAEVEKAEVEHLEKKVPAEKEKPSRAYALPGRPRRTREQVLRDIFYSTLSKQGVPIKEGYRARWRMRLPELLRVFDLEEQEGLAMDFAMEIVQEYSREVAMRRERFIKPEALSPEMAIERMVSTARPPVEMEEEKPQLLGLAKRRCNHPDHDKPDWIKENPGVEEEFPGGLFMANVKEERAAYNLPVPGYYRNRRFNGFCPFHRHTVYGTYMTTVGKWIEVYMWMFKVSAARQGLDPGVVKAGGLDPSAYDHPVTWHPPESVFEYWKSIGWRAPERIEEVWAREAEGEEISPEETRQIEEDIKKYEGVT